MQSWTFRILGGLMAMTAAVRAEPPAPNHTAAWPAGVLIAHTADADAPPLRLPVQHTDARLRLIAGIVSATVTQTFSNDTASTLEGVYLFPLPSRAAVTDMELRIGDRRIFSVVQAKAEARATYAAARATGKRAALMEAERPNLFRTSLANLQPGEAVAITFTYTEPAELQEGIYNVSFPMAVGERYFPESAAAPDPAEMGPPLATPAAPHHHVNLSLEIYGLPVEHVTSATHELTVVPLSETLAGAWRVTPAHGPLPADRVFSVDIEPPLLVDPVPTWVTHDASDGRYGLLTLFPSMAPTQTPPTSRDVVFLVDTSGSMNGEPMGQARQGLDACLTLLRPIDRFAIIRFSDDFSAFHPELTPATPARVADARTYVAGLEASGGTEMQPALAHGLDLLAPSPHLPLLVFMTDGAVGNEAALMRLVNARLGRTRLFAFGIGGVPNEYLMRKMAALGRGQAYFIRADEDVGVIIETFFHTLASPRMTDITLTWRDAFDLPLAATGTYPSRCPDLFVDRPLQVVAAFGDQTPAAVDIVGTVDGAERHYRFPLGAHGLAHALVGRLYGQAQVDEWMTQMAVAPGADAGLALKERIVAAALEHQLVTPFTSRVAVEERLVRVPDGTPGGAGVSPGPSTPPTAWDPTPTATQDLLMLLLGGLAMLAGVGPWWTTGTPRERTPCHGED